MHMRTNTRLIMLLMLSVASPAMAVESFSFTPTFSNGSLRWSVETDGSATASNPTLHVVRGQTYDFIVEANSGHPFYVKTISSTGGGNAYAGFPQNDIQTSSSKTVSFTVPDDAPDALFYNCSIHSSMAGAIEVSVFRDGFD